MVLFNKVVADERVRSSAVYEGASLHNLTTLLQMNSDH
jgi:hypothetical protein